MSERASGGNDVTEKRSDVTKREDAAQSGLENKEKARGGATESIAVVKSKIREKNAVQGQQEEETLGNLKVPNVTNSKISHKIPKHKRGKSKSNEALETQDNTSDDMKSENVPPEEVQNSNSEYKQNESKAAVDMSSIVSKKSIMSKKSMAKSASKLIALTEDDDNTGNITSNVTSKISIGGNYENDESLSTFVISHDAEPQKEEMRSSVVDNLPDFRQEKAQRTPVHVHERGNYMTSMSPTPLEEYPAPKEPKDPKEVKEQREQREPKEQRELKEIKEQREVKEQREQREIKDQREQREAKEQREQREQREHKEHKEQKEHKESKEGEEKK